MATDDQIQYSGEYKLEKLELITLNGNIDLVNNYVQIDLFESIFTNTISGSLTIVDTNNLLLNSPIIGQEYLRLKIKSPGVANADSIDYSENVLSVYKVGQTFDASKGSQVIELSLISPEALTNQRTRVSKSYVTSMNEIVKDVVTNKLYLDSRKNLFLEFSVGDKRMVSPNIHPFSLIDMIASETQATDLNNVTTNDINYHVFYENTKGFHFKSLSYLFSQETQGDFHGGDVGTIERKGKELEDYKRVISFERTGNVDMLQNIVSGMLGSTQITHDIYTKSYRIYNYSYFDDYPRIDENPIYSDSFIDYQNRTVGGFRTHFKLDSDTGNLVIGHDLGLTTTTSTAYKLNVNGTFNANLVYAGGNLIQSDKRLKNNIKDLDSQLEVVKKLKPRRFDWKKDQSSDIGFIAQELQKVVPELVGEAPDNEKTLHVAYGKLTPILVKAIQEQQKMIEKLSARIDELEK